MKNYKAKNVEEFVNSAESYAQPHLRKLRAIIKTALPKAEEKISWGIPFYWNDGALVGFSSFKNHISFGFAFTLNSQERKQIEKIGYKTGSKTIQIRFDQEVPVKLINRILKNHFINR